MRYTLIMFGSKWENIIKGFSEFIRIEYDEWTNKCGCNLYKEIRRIVPFQLYYVCWCIEPCKILNYSCERWKMIDFTHEINLIL